MREAEYYRSQADLCFRLAAQISDRHEAEKLRAKAAEYRAKADELEGPLPPPPLSSSLRPDD